MTMQTGDQEIRRRKCFDLPIAYRDNVELPDAADADGSVGPYQASTSAINAAIAAGQKKRDYSRIRVPVLALTTFPCSPANGGNDRCVEHPNDRLKYQPANALEQAAIERFESLEAAYIRRWKTNIRQTAGKYVRVVDVPRASHHIFLSHEADVLQEISTFVTEP